VSSPAPNRFARRQWRRRLRSARPWLITAAVVVVVGLAAYAVLFSPWLTADHVEVSGEEILDAEQIESAGAVDLGTPLARVDLDEIRARVSALPPVASVEVHRSWPHTVSIDVVERTALVAVRQGDSWWVMDADGVVFRETGEPEAGLPKVTFAAQADLSARQEVASVVSALPAALLADVRQVSARSMDSITLAMKDGTQITWGSADETDRKAAVLALLLKKVKAQTYDVSVPERPTTSGAASG
jgi:cell division protein FtsQ